MQCNHQRRYALPTIGGRVIKTGIAVAMSLAVCRAFNVPEPVFAGVAAVICMQPTVLQTFRKGFERLQATVIGALIGLGMIALVTLYPLPYVRPVAAGLAVIIVMWLCLLFRWMDALVLAAATVVVIMIQSELPGNITVYAAERTLVTAIGVVVASLVNAFMFWPRVEDRFPRRLPGIAEQAFREFEQAVTAFCDRDLSSAKAYLSQWNEEKEAFTQAASELTWFVESTSVRHIVPLSHENQPPVFSEIYFTLESIHQTTARLLEDTVQILEEHPDYVVQDAEVYRIIKDALQPSAGLAAAIVDALKTGDRSILEETNHNWSQELHMQFVRSIRAAHRSPKDIFPLFEVAKFGTEIRSYTRSLVRLRELLISECGIGNFETADERG